MAHEKFPEAGEDQLAALSVVAEAFRATGTLTGARAGTSIRMTGAVRSSTRTANTVVFVFPERSTAVSLTLRAWGVGNANVGPRPVKMIGDGSPAMRNSHVK